MVCKIVEEYAEEYAKEYAEELVEEKILNALEKGWILWI